MSVLYHASTNKNLDVLTPQRTISNNKYIGDYLFATKNKTLAIMYLATRRVPILMNITHEEPYIVLCADQYDYEKNDNGGAVYEIPDDTFHETPQTILSDFEVVSKEPVKPTAIDRYTTSLGAMANHDIRIYFVGETEFESLVGAKDQDERVFRLKRYLQSP